MSYERRSDLAPPLGRPGGPCHVVRRIDEEVPNPKLKDHLVDKVEGGESLSNSEAAKVYDVEVERARGIVKKIYIGPHAQYRMDLRGVTVGDVQKAVDELGKQFYTDRKSGDPRKMLKYEDFVKRGQPLEFVTKQNLKIVLAPHADGAKLVTTFWKGRPDPKSPAVCRIADRVSARFLRKFD